MLIWTDFDSFTITDLILVACFKKKYFPIEGVLNSLQAQKGLELVFRPQFSYNFLVKFFLL